MQLVIIGNVLDNSQFSAGFPQHCTSASPLSRQGRTKSGLPPGTEWRMVKQSNLMKELCGITKRRLGGKMWIFHTPALTIEKIHILIYHPPAHRNSISTETPGRGGSET